MNQTMSAPGPAAGAQARYFQLLAQGRFLIQHCQDCGRYVFYPRQLCPHCASCALSFVEPKGTGTVYSSTVVRRKPESGGDYDVSLVDLDEGIRMMSRVEGVAPGAVRIGMRVKARVALDGKQPMVVFDPCQEAP